MADNIFDNTEIAFKSKSNAQLKKTSRLFKLIANPKLTKLGNDLSRILLKYNAPFIKGIIKNTLFQQFVGGETLDESLPTVYALYKYHIYSILDYSVEGNATDAGFERTYQEILENIRWAKEKVEIPFVVFKPTGIGNIDLYEKVGNNEELNEEEKMAWERILFRFGNLANAAQKNDVPMLVDAEESWMQKAVDDIVEQLMITYNTKRVIVANTLQMYRKDRLEYLKQQYEKAKDADYFLGFKVVRGAYMEKENARAELKGYETPIQPNKQATDDAFNEAVDFILERTSKIGLYIGTHNEESCKLAVEKMDELNLPHDYFRSWFGQLYGMSDNLTYNLAHMGFNVAKYVPYGPVKEVVPYLSRRAQENTSVAGQTGRELSLIKKELQRRKLAGKQAQ